MIHVTSANFERNGCVPLTNHYSLSMEKAYQILLDNVTPDDASRLLHLATSHEEVRIINKNSVLAVNFREGYYNIELPEVTEGRVLDVQERMWLRHLLQVLSEHAHWVRDDIDPGSGLKITDTVWMEQWHALKQEIDVYTRKLRSGKSNVMTSKIMDHNE